MSITESFRAAWIFEAGWHGTDLLPTALAHAATSALTIDAAGLSLIGHHQHLPIAASSL